VIGRVELAEGANVWYGCVLRGDNDWIHVGRNVNVQDGCVLHTDTGYPMTLADGVSVGTPGDAARLHCWRRLADRHPVGGAERREDRRALHRRARARWSPKARSSRMVR
jgi:carbonic anhydrase/acetyltransferase-like protein (isoleucine patch superfamily)